MDRQFRHKDQDPGLFFSVPQPLAPMMEHLTSYFSIPMAFACFDWRPGTGCRKWEIFWAMGRIDRKVDGELIRSGKGQRQMPRWEKRKKTPKQNTFDQELETGFRSHVKGQSINSEGQKMVIAEGKECGELPQQIRASNLISRSQREGWEQEVTGMVVQ